MNIISKEIIKNRIGGFHTRHVYKTFDTVLSMAGNEDIQIQSSARLMKYLCTAFIREFIERDKSVTGMPTLMFKEKNVTKEREDLRLLFEKADYDRAGRRQHDIVEEYFMRYDPNTIAVEIPLFDDEKTGFIDIIRLGEKIEIVDFKPHAHKENVNKVLSQIYRYKEMLSDLAHIPKKDIDCFYGDKYNIYTFSK